MTTTAAAAPTLFTKTCESLFQSSSSKKPRWSLENVPVAKYLYESERTRAKLLKQRDSVIESVYNPAVFEAEMEKFRQLWANRGLTDEQSVDLYERLTEQFVKNPNPKFTDWILEQRQYALTHRIQLKLIEAYKATSNPTIRAKIGLLLFEISSTSPNTFASETMAFFDQLPIEDKHMMTHMIAKPGYSYERMSDRFATWTKRLELLWMKDIVFASHRSRGVTDSFDIQLADYVRNQLEPDYYDRFMQTLVKETDRQSNFDQFENPVVKHLARIIRNRFSYGLRARDRNDRIPDFVEKSADVILIVISRIAESNSNEFTARDRADVIQLLNELNPMAVTYLNGRWPEASKIATEKQIVNVFEGFDYERRFEWAKADRDQ